MSELDEYFKSKSFKDALIKQLKDLSMHANTAILCLVDGKYKEAYGEIFLAEALARSLRVLFEAMITKSEEKHKSEKHEVIREE
ncbi:MAG: hypothetical protein ACXQTI_03775 [Candidatus Nezhaarchaeales archaeon]